MRVVALPVDARPAVRAQVVALAATGGVDLVVPPVEALGHFRKPADRDSLAAWLMHEAARADGVVISLDMLVYGGLVPSRFIEDDGASLIARFEVLRSLRRQYPKLPIYAFAATMRISNNNVAEEEKTYWAQHGEAIWQWSWHRDRALVRPSADNEQAARTAEVRVPAEIRDDYLATRSRNFAVTLAALELVEAGVIDRMVLPQDDTAEWGFNIAEQRQLEGEVQRCGLTDRVLIYPGADEAVHTLCAHLVARQRSGAPLRVALQLADPQGIVGLRARYEDRPIVDSIAAQFAAAGAEIVTGDDALPPDVVVGVWTRGTAQGDWAMRIGLDDARSDVEVLSDSQSWFASLLRESASGVAVAVVDLAYANGGDPTLIAGLQRNGILTRLAAYAGWNTASNSLGNLAAQLVLARHDFAAPSNRALLVLRLLEDYLYQATWRQRVRDKLHAEVGSAGAFDESSTTPAAQLRCVESLFVPAANAWLEAQGLPYRVSAVALPWQRTFEIDIALTTSLEPAGAT
jgi:hypothetical protein